MNQAQLDALPPPEPPAAIDVPTFAHIGTVALDWKQKASGE